MAEPTKAGNGGDSKPPVGDAQQVQVVTTYPWLMIPGLAVVASVLCFNFLGDGLRDAALESLKVIKARDAQGLFDVGDKIDKACEGCHLEYWYPGDKKAVLEDKQKRVTYDKPKK